MSKPVIRCAIYTRKSSEEGLGQEFNSLDAQYEACAAYIASQRHEGWKQAPSRYDDGGISGGTMERPALRRLLTDIDVRRVDMVVVYKIDRLTRSLADFVRLVERLEAAGCSFVSVTQAFNTSTSMGRLTLNVLLSFAQFEREVTGERIRDKIAASKRKGLWMGGLPPIGYDPHPDKTRRELVVNAEEAVVVRKLFDLYLAHGCLNATARAATLAGLRSKHRSFPSGRTQGGTDFSRGQIHKLLTNPIYIGLIRHHDKTCPGQHSAIIDDLLWSQVQNRLQAASARRRGSGGASAITGKTSTGAPTVPLSAPLLGRFRDETGDRLTPSHTQRHGRRFRYYVSHRLVAGARCDSGWRLPAPAFEAAVVNSIASHLECVAEGHAVLLDGPLPEVVAAANRARAVAAGIRADGIALIAPAIVSGEVAPGTMHISLDRAVLATLLGHPAEQLSNSLLAVQCDFVCRRRGVELKIVAGTRAAEADATLLRALRNAHSWTRQLRSGTALREIALAAGVPERYIARIIPLATLSPRLQQNIVEGTQPISMTLQSLVGTSLPLDWTAQEKRFARPDA